MSNRDALEIFRQFWPEHGFAGVEPHLPGWTRKRASNFAHRNGIKMRDSARRVIFKEAGKRGGESSVKPRVDSLENRFLSAKW